METVNGRELTRVNGKTFYKEEYELYTGWLAGVKKKRVFAKSNEELRTAYWKGYIKGRDYEKWETNNKQSGPDNPYFMIEPNEIDPETEEFVVV